jgi:predicted TPR repeat methyltransferase
MRSMYADPEVYTAQLRALEQSVTQFPDMAYGHFLLAYHYLVGGYRDAAVRELREAVRLQPDDKLAQALLASLTSPDAGGGRSAPPSPGR